MGFIVILKLIMLKSHCLFNFHAGLTMQNSGLYESRFRNQDCWEKYQQPQICRWYHSNVRKWRGTWGWMNRVRMLTWNSTLEKLQPWHPVICHHFMANRRGKNWSHDRFCFLGSKITADGECIHEINTLVSWKESYNKYRSEVKSHSVVSDSLQPHGLYSPWNSSGQSMRVGSCSLLQGIFQTRNWTQETSFCLQGSVKSKLWFLQ